MRNISDKIVQKFKTHFMFHNFLFRKSCLLWDKMEKYVRARQATSDNIIRCMRSSCWMTKAGTEDT